MYFVCERKMFEMLECVVEDLLSSAYFLPPFLHADDVYAKYMLSAVGVLNVYTILPRLPGVDISESMVMTLNL